jgi:hypothetical protein
MDPVFVHALSLGLVGNFSKTIQYTGLICKTIFSEFDMYRIMVQICHDNILNKYICNFNANYDITCHWILEIYYFFINYLEKRLPFYRQLYLTYIIIGLLLHVYW